MYNVQMKRYSVGMVRERLAEALDEADRGVPIVIERRGVRYTLAVERKPAKKRSPRRLLSLIDPAVMDGDWTWDVTKRGLRFRGRRS
jgi:hypothetical protein